jgi:hypothetical protein
MESFMLTMPSVAVQNKFGGVAHRAGRSEMETMANAQKMIRYMDEIVCGQCRCAGFDFSGHQHLGS